MIPIEVPRTKTITPSEAATMLWEDSTLTIGYLSKSDKPYLCVLKEIPKDHNYGAKLYGFLTPCGYKLKYTYTGRSLMAAIENAVLGGREVKVLTKEDLSNV